MWSVQHENQNEKDGENEDQLLLLLHYVYIKCFFFVFSLSQPPPCLRVGFFCDNFFFALDLLVLLSSIPFWSERTDFLWLGNG